MLLSRFWYVVMAVALGAVTFALFLAASMFDRANVRAMGEALAGDSQLVGSVLRDDARKRSTALIVPSLDEDIRAHLAKASASPDKIPPDSKDKVRSALRKQFNAVPADQKFDALLAVDQTGRVVAQMGFDQASGIDNFEVGGYPLVADALHGWVRDDSWVLGNRIYRVVGRPVENDVTQMPAGAIIGLRALDDSYARDLSRRTGAAIGFYANGARVSSGAPEGFDTAQLDTISNDLKALDADASYKEKGFSDARTLHGDLGVFYARLVGEAWDVGAGYAVARTAHPIGSPMGFLHSADDKDTKSVPVSLIVVVSFLIAAIGLLFTYLEHSRPLAVFRGESERFAKGSAEQLTPSKFRGIYRRIASDINDGMDKIAAKGGAPRRAADLASVLGPMPVQPAMSAFSLPQNTPPGPAQAAPASAERAPSSQADPARAAGYGNAPAFVPPAVPQRATPEPAQQLAGPMAGGAGAPPPMAPAPKPMGLPTRTGSPTMVGVAPAAPPAPKPLVPAGRPAMGSSPGVVSSVTGRTAAMNSSPGFTGLGPPRAALGSSPGAPVHRAEPEDDDEATVVSHVPNDILGQLSPDKGTTRPAPMVDEAVEWRQVFEDFVRLKKECGEPTDTINFEKFRNTLRKNRDQLLQRHGCKSVKFNVYVKDGKAALKANPVRE
jgi:hypothetical protein